MSIEKDYLYHQKSRHPYFGGLWGTGKLAGQEWTGAYRDPEPNEVGDRFIDCEYDAEKDEVGELQWNEITSVWNNGTEFTARVVGPVFCQCGGAFNSDFICPMCGRKLKELS